MKPYRVTVKSTVYTVLIVEAENEAEAMQLADRGDAEDIYEVLTTWSEDTHCAYAELDDEWDEDEED